MAVRQPGDIRNVAIVGHSSAGKTTLGEAILFKTGVTTRLGSVDDGTSLLDCDEESKDRRHSTESSVFHVEHDGKLLNFVDTPGTFDYTGYGLASLCGVDTAVIVVSAAAGIGVNTRRMFQAARDFGLARMIVITRFDTENADIEATLSAIQETFGAECQPINLPSQDGAAVIDLLATSEGSAAGIDLGQAHTSLVEAIVETDDALLEQYMEAGAVAREKLAPALSKAVASGALTPILFCASTKGVGVSEALGALVAYAPSPLQAKPRLLKSGEGDDATEKALSPAEDQPFVAQVFKLHSDPKSNIRHVVARVLSGKLGGDGHLFPSGDRKGQRVGHVTKPQGDKFIDVELAGPGDIVAFAKLEAHIGQVLFDKAGEGVIERPKFPTPMASLAIQPKARGDVEKISGALHRFAEEDPCFVCDRDHETHELLIQGLGDQHLAVVQSKMKRYYKLEVDTKPPKIPYRETITGSVKYVEHTHKKQTGGAGQFARVFIDMEPNERGAGYEFNDKIFGGSIDQAYRPSVDKGVKEQMKRGVIAGCPVVDVKVALVDGKTHPVDSKDIAFQIAGRQVFKKAFMQCKPILLEPVVTIEVTVPADNMGDITRDLAGKRGQITGQDMLPGGQICVRAIVPLGEVAGYGSQLNSVTGGQGSFVMEFSHYDIVPANVQQQIVAAHKPREEED